MKTFSPLFLLGTLGVLSTVAGTALAQVDTSQWKCEACPFEKSGVSASVDAGVGWVSDRSAKFGDYTGLDRRGAYFVGGADMRYRGPDGLYSDVQASTDTGAIKAELSQEGRYTARIGYAEIPHRLSDASMTPYQGVGSSSLTLPAGFAGSTTATMPLLAATLHPVDLGFKRTRYDADLSVPVGDNWTHRVAVRHDVKDGTQRLSGSFFSNATQLVAPVDQVTDQFEVSSAYNSRQWQASLSYNASLFRNGADRLTWDNAFSMGATGPTRGQFALAPDNQFHQIRASGGYQVTPRVRASADIAFGRMTQNAGFADATLNTSLGSPALPAGSANAGADTFNGSFRLAINATDRLRVNASYARDTRDNTTTSLGYPAVRADTFLDPALRYNQPYTFKQDRYKLEADYRGPGGLKASFGLQEDDVKRTLQDAVTTRDTSAWGRVALQVRDNLSLALKLAHSARANTGYQATSPEENAWLRRFNLAERKRDTVGLRADFTPAEGVSIGLNADYSKDRYPQWAVGLNDARNLSFGGDVSAMITDETQVHAFAQGDRLKSRQSGSQSLTRPDWWARSDDAADVIGLGVKHSALKGKLDLAADLTYTRSRSMLTVNAVSTDPGFPTATTAMDGLRLSATYRLQDNLWLTGSFWYEYYNARDWQLDGVRTSTVPDLLALGTPAPHYNINVVRVGLRYRF